MKKNGLMWMVFVAAGLLAALGCWFLWRSPMEWLYGANQHSQAMRQMVYNGVGIALFFGAWALGWNRWLKMAPWLAVAWVALCVAAQFGRPINGVHRWVVFGPLHFNVRTLLWPVAALFAGWLCAHRRIKPWMVIGVALVYVLYMCVAKLSYSVDLYTQNQMRLAVETARWFGSAGLSLRFLPDPNTTGVIACASVVLGKWAVVCAALLMGVIASGLADFRRRVDDPPRRTYLLVFGVVLAWPACWSLLQNLALVRAVGCTFSLLGYGGTDVLCTWLGLGIAVAAARGAESEEKRVGRAWLPWAIGSGVVVVMLSALFWAPVEKHMRFAEPSPRLSDFGPFGMEPVRGTILAADGTLLASSVGRWQVHVDPQAVEYNWRIDTNDVVEAVSEELGLPEDLVRRAYSHPKSRYVPLSSHVDGEELAWCQDEWNRRRYGLVLECVQRRNYPLGADAAHVTGCCASDGWRNAALVGASGLEHACRKVLDGQWGRISRSNTLAENMRTGFPTNGGVVRTTIQYSVQRAVSGILNEAAAMNHAESAWALVVAVPKGEIVAMASYPTYDPNATGRPVDSTDALANGAVQTLHEPGGLMKPLICTMAVDAGIAMPEDATDWSNATFTNLCHSVGTNRMWQGITKFRFGQTLGEGLLCGEEVGIVRPLRKWDPISFDCLGMGQGLAISGVQLAQAYATLANGGVLVTPYLVKSMTDAAGNTVFAHAEKSEERVVSAEAVAATTSRLLAQTNAAFRIGNTAVAVKTSTFALVEEHRQCNYGNYSTRDFDALCAGYFPAEKPVYAVVVGFRKPKPEHSAEKVALPAFKAIVDKLR